MIERIFVFFMVYCRFTSSLLNNAAIVTRKLCNYAQSSSDLVTSKHKVFDEEGLLLHGIVANGYGRGSKKLGFPTANLPHFNRILENSKIKNGVYFGFANLSPDSMILPVVTNIGFSPTFTGSENKIRIAEAHLIAPTSNGLSDFYGKKLGLFLIGFIREEQKFPSLDALKLQIQNDVDLTKLLCSNAINGIESSSATQWYQLSKRLFEALNSPIQNGSYDMKTIESILQSFSASNISIQQLLGDSDVGVNDNSNNSNNNLALWAQIPLKQKL